MENRKIVAEADSELISKILHRYVPYWPLFILMLMFGLGAAWLYLNFATPYYRSTARILIQDENKGTVDPEALESLNLLSTKKIIENELEVIQSRTLISEVVKNLHLYATVDEELQFNNRSAYTKSPIIVEAKHPDEINKSDKIHFHFDATLKNVYIDDVSYPLNMWVITRWDTLRFKPNPNYRKGYYASSLFFSLVNPKHVANSIQKRLSVSTASRASSILNLSLDDESPERGEDILNEMLISYNSASMKDKNSLALNTLNFVEGRLTSVQHEVDSIERSIQRYRHRKGAIDISTQGKLFLESVSANDQKLSEINMQLAVLNQIEGYLHDKDKSHGIVPSTLGVSDVLLSKLVDKLYMTELEFESLKNTTAENNPMLISLRDQIDKIKPSIFENIQSQRRGLLASRTNLSATNEAYSSMLRMLPQTEKELIDINREQKIKNEIYTFLLQKREETALSHASILSESRIIDRAESLEKPVSPNKKIIYLSAALLAFLFVVGIVGIKETLNRKVMFRNEIEQSTKLPIIGEISLEHSKKMIVIGDERRTFIAEQFRSLRTSLAFIGVNAMHKRIMVTSSISGEGKSFIATNLALSLALTGKKVLLLDLDLNLNGPTLKEKLSIQQQKGVSDFLLGEADAQDIILKTDIHENLFFVSKGKITKNPTELLLNERLEGLLNFLNITFDYVVIDTAPVGVVTDAYSVSPYCDATLYIIRHGYTPKVCIQRIDENNRINQLNNPAIVFNGVQARGFGSKNYGYGYGYGYLHQDKKRQRGLRISNK